MILRVTPEQREALLDALPEVFSLNAHYEPHPWVIVRLAGIDESLLVDLVKEAWSLVAPRPTRTARPRR